jgi:hypothetical protein
MTEREKAMRTVMLRHKRIASVILIVLAVTAFYLYVNYTNTTFPIINPPQEEHTIPVRADIYLGGLNLSRTPDISIGLWIHFKGVLTVNTTVILTANGTLNTPLARGTVTLVDISFHLSLAFPPMNDTNGLPATTSVTLYPTFMFQRQLRMASPATIFFPNSGDYAPTVGIGFYNFTEIEKTFPTSALHVEPLSELQAEIRSKTDQALTVVITIFAAVEGVSLYMEHWEKKIEWELQSKSNNRSESAKESKTVPDKTKPS